MVDLREDYQRVERLWHGIKEDHLPLSLAAAWALHRVHRHEQLVVPRVEYDSVLNLIAAGLSRLLKIYTLDERSLPVPVEVPLAAGRFHDGATRFERSNGHTLAPLVVRRDDLPRAVRTMATARLPVQFSDALAPDGKGRPGRRP